VPTVGVEGQGADQDSGRSFSCHHRDRSVNRKSPGPCRGSHQRFLVGRRRRIGVVVQVSASYGGVFVVSEESKNGGVAVNLMTSPRREEPCVIIRWPVLQTGWQ
jgi:hypothetical protein